MTTQPARKRLVLHDGYNMSVQASSFHYCDPKIDSDFEEIDPHKWVWYKSVEVGFPSEHEILLEPYKEDLEDTFTSSVFPYVPATVVQEIIDKHGGVGENSTRWINNHLPCLDIFSGVATDLPMRLAFVPDLSDGLINLNRLRRDSKWRKLKV